MENKDDLVKYKFERSLQTIEEAKELATNNFWNGVINRLYYASFYAVSALLIKNGFNSKTLAGRKVNLMRCFY